MTLDDLEQSFCTLFQNMCVFGTYHENLNENRPNDPYNQWHRCSAMAVVSGNIKCMQIFMGVPWRASVGR